MGVNLVGGLRGGRLHCVHHADPALTRPASAAPPGGQVYGEAAPALRELGLLHPRDLGRPVGALSVGQRRRLALAGEFEEAISRSPGTVVVASHDRWLRRRWAGTALALSAL